MPKPRIAIVTCYRQPDYVRAVSLRQGLRDSDLFEEVIVIKNKHTGVLRYLEVIGQLLKVRFTKNPDVYLLTFRGYEMLPVVLLIALGKKVIYDELINPYEWFVYEHKKFSDTSLQAKLLRGAYRFMGKRVAAVIADTPSHAAYSAELLQLPPKKYMSIPVSTDEQTFAPQPVQPHQGFRVIYYGSMLPLHGLSYVIEAAVDLADHPDIVFHLIGGKKEVVEKIEAARERGAHIEYDEWVDYAKLPGLVAQSDLCLGGPFGGTVQSQFVITGKTYQFLASAKPVIIGDNKESHVFTNKETALIVPEANSATLKDTILWAYDHPKELARIGQAGRELYLQSFSNKQVAADLRRLFADNRILNMQHRTNDK